MRLLHVYIHCRKRFTTLRVNQSNIMPHQTMLSCFALEQCGQEPLKYRVLELLCGNSGVARISFSDTWELLFNATC